MTRLALLALLAACGSHDTAEPAPADAAHRANEYKMKPDPQPSGLTRVAQPCEELAARYPGTRSACEQLPTAQQECAASAIDARAIAACAPDSALAKLIASP